MVTLRELNKRVIFTISGIAIFYGALLSGCTEQPAANSGLARYPPASYSFPSTYQTFNIGQIHNAELIYIFSHYDTVKYASYPNKFSETGIDSLAALFIADSLNLTPGEITACEAVFNANFDSSSYLETHSSLVASVDSAVSNGFLASDEASFIIQADTDIWKCTTYAETNDTIGSLITQYSSISWAPSTSHGVEAYDYLSIANASCHLWGGASGNGGANDPMPIAAHPIGNDPDGFAQGMNLYGGEQTLYGWSDDQVTEMAVAMGDAKSAQAAMGNGNGPGKGSSGNNPGGGFPWGAYTPITIAIIVVFVLSFFL